MQLGWQVGFVDVAAEIALLDMTYAGRTPWPNFSLQHPTPLPMVVIPAAGTVDAAVFAIKSQDRSGLTIEAGGSIFRVSGEIWNNALLNNIVFGVSFALTLSGTGNGLVIVDLDTEDDTQSTLETSHFTRQLTTNQRQATFGLPEQEAGIPGLILLGSAFYDLLMRLSTDFGNERTATLDYLEVYALKIGEMAP